MKGDIEEAFDLLLEELKMLQGQVTKEGALALQSGRFDAAKEAVRQAEGINKVILKVHVAEEEWRASKKGKDLPAIPPRERKPISPGPKGQRGILSLQIIYRLPILQVLQSMGGRGRTREVTDKVFELVKGSLNEADLALRESTGEETWRNRACWERLVMVELGLLEKSSPRGVWEISEAGRKWLAENSGK